MGKDSLAYGRCAPRTQRVGETQDPSLLQRLLETLFASMSHALNLFAAQNVTYYFFIVLYCRYHLQALRHLYVLAAEPRLILPKDVDSGKPCYAPIEIVFKVCICEYVTCSDETGNKSQGRCFWFYLNSTE